MAEITPPPSRGSILEVDLFTGSWAAQPSRGSILEVDLFTGWNQGGWHVGRVVW